MKTVVKPSNSAEFSIEKNMVAKIDPHRCTNCGKCREMCPVEAVSEQQRVICRLCPSCTSQPALTHDEMFSLATEKSCTTACPLGISPQGYINLSRSGKNNEAYQRIWDKNPLPSICSYICHHPCEQACKRGILVDEPLAIRGIKRYLTENVEFVPHVYPVNYEETVAIIGAGPSGLSAAHHLSMQGYRVTVFDSETRAGGMMQRAIPNFRIPREIIDKELTKLENAGITFKFGHHVSIAEIEELKSEYDAIVIATGTPHSKELHIEGWRKEGVTTALGFIERINNGQNLWRHPGQEFKLDNARVVVIGGGDVAMDCARTAVRLGATKVTCACPESCDTLPAHAWEKAEAEEEGIKIIYEVAPKKYFGTHNVLEGVEFAKVTEMGKNSADKFVLKTDDNEITSVDADWVIVAIGQSPDQKWLQFKDKDGIYYAGDISGSSCSVIDAMASGKEIAEKIIKDLGNIADKDTLSLRKLNLATLDEKIYPATRLKVARPDMPIVPVEERIKNFDAVEGSYTKDTVEIEEARCLECGYQLIDTHKCIGCGVCKAICPKGNAITMVPVE